MNQIGIIDVGIGNIGSLNSAIYELGFDVCLVNDLDTLNNCDSLILPGVGSFYHGMSAIKAAGLIKPINNHITDKKPLLGICLGMQLLFDYGNEGRSNKGLGFIPGTVDRIKEKKSFHIPHVGWNTVTQVQNHPILHGIKSDVDFYFVHSYRVKCNSKYVIGNTEYSETFPTIVFNDSIVGMQFHPEKSQKNGLRILENFCLWGGNC